MDFGNYTDPRDGQVYKTVMLRDGRVWLAENLRYKMQGSIPADDELPSGCKSKYQTYDPNQYGRLYSQQAAIEASPPGWRLPNTADWKRMLKRYGGFGRFENLSYRRRGRDDAICLIRTDLNVHFGGSASGTSQQDCGNVYYGNFTAGRFWTSSHPWHDKKSGIYFIFYIVDDVGSAKGMILRSQENPWLGFSVRCIKE